MLATLRRASTPPRHARTHAHYAHTRTRTSRTHAHTYAVRIQHTVHAAVRGWGDRVGVIAPRYILRYIHTYARHTPTDLDSLLPPTR
jgi:hypothetical protein